MIEPSDEGTAQGSLISPPLANIYLHYVFDFQARQWRKRYAEGNVVIVRYADDIVTGFDKPHNAKRFRRATQQRLARFGLSVHSEKTRLIEFGRFATRNRARRGLSKPETFNLLGFTHIPNCRIRSAIGMPNSACLRAATICSTEYCLRFIANLPCHGENCSEPLTLLPVQETEAVHRPLRPGRKPRLAACRP